MEETYKDISERFLTLEEDLNLFESRIDGVRFWEYIRSEVHQEILERTGLIGRVHTEKGVTVRERLKGVYLWARNLVYKSSFFGEERDMLFFGHPRRKLEEDGLWWDLYCDPILDTLELDYRYIEYDYQLDHASPAKTEDRDFVDFINYSGTIWKTVRPNTLSEGDAKLLETVSEEIENRFDCSIDIEGKVRDALADREVTYPLYKLLLRRVDPEVVITVVSYGKESFIEACDAYDVPVVELQHGTINQYHMGYSFRGERTKRTFPDYFFSFGSFWTGSVELPLPKSHIFDIGYPYLEGQFRKYSGVEPTGSIIFISQGSIGERLSKFALEVNELVGAEREVVYKLHPGEYDRWRDEYPWLVDSDITVVDEERPSLYRLFAEAAVQVGVYSTAVYEGMIFELQTYLVDLPGVEYMEGLLTEDHVKLVGEPSEVVVNGDGSREFDVDRYFTPNPINNFNEALDAILRKENQS
ncbi:hypothetical protein SAMN04488063_1663 [Halopelagius inordinatus]|uniref:CDP-Glycerol:Poly(Glycerophosphate) glycerophosphotransferase n=2 Tax=Halopelagius inordinatus TaxID=553467 RepID=A0A1I2PNE0_9EURY|nr:hypothetical protein SAMN04488063_1663 [Halopelagius inordinatus]